MNEEENKKIVDQITANIISTTKEVLTSEETAKYMGISLGYLYKLTCKKEIPHYKPMGKMCYFNRVEVEKWLQSNRVAPKEELEQQAVNYVVTGKMKGGRV